MTAPHIPSKPSHRSPQARDSHKFRPQGCSAPDHTCCRTPLSPKGLACAWITFKAGIEAVWQVVTIHHGAEDNGMVMEDPSVIGEGGLLQEHLPAFRLFPEGYR